MKEMTDSLHFIAAIVAGDNPEEGSLEIEGYSHLASAWPELILLAQGQGVGSLFLKRIQEGATGPSNRDMLSPLISGRNQAAVHYMLATQVRRKVENAFRKANVPCIWLKGIVLAQTAYSSPELRPMVDVDVLVPYDRRREALELAQSNGFGLETNLLFDGREGLKHHYFLESKNFKPVQLELHYRLLGSMDRILRVEDHQWFWHHVEELECVAGDKMMTLVPEAHLLYLCAHAILQHGETDMRLLRLYDLDRLLAMKLGFDWSLLIEGAVRMRWTYAVERALTLSREYFGTLLPDGVLVELAARRPDNEEIEHARRRTVQRSKTEIVVHDLTAMSWADRVRTASRIVAPPPDYMRHRYGLDANRGLPAAYLRRMGRIASETVYTIRKKARRN